MKDAKSDASGKEMVQKSLATAEHQVKKASKCKQDNGVDCDDVAPGAGVDQTVRSKQIRLLHGTE